MKNSPAILTASLLALPALAGPDATTNYFINNSPSLLDFGNYRLEEYLSSAPDMDFSVFYEWDRDEITIVHWKFGENSPKSKDDCREIIDRVRGFAGYKDGALRFDQKQSFFSSFYAHDGYVSGDRDVFAGKQTELDKKFVVVCWAEGKRYEGALSGTEIKSIEF